MNSLILRIITVRVVQIKRNHTTSRHKNEPLSSVSTKKVERFHLQHHVLSDTTFTLHENIKENTVKSPVIIDLMLKTRFSWKK